MILFKNHFLTHNINFKQFTKVYIMCSHISRELTQANRRVSVRHAIVVFSSAILQKKKKKVNCCESVLYVQCYTEYLHGSDATMNNRLINLVLVFKILIGGYFLQRTETL